MGRETVEDVGISCEPECYFAYAEPNPAEMGPGVRMGALDSSERELYKRGGQTGSNFWVQMRYSN